MSTIGSNFTVSNCISNLPTKFGNRQDLNSVMDGTKTVLAVWESIKELTETYEFEELKYQTPVPSATPLNLTAGQPVVPISTLLATMTTNFLYPQFLGQNWVDITDIYTFWMWFSGGVNQAGRALKYRRVTTIDTYSYGITSNNQGQLGVAPPVYYTRFGINLQVGPVPDQNYQYFVRMKLRHPFPVIGNTPFVPAVLSATISTAGVVNSLSLVSPGSGYPPNNGVIPVVFSINGSTSPPGVTNAVGTAQSNSAGALSAVFLVSGGSGYTSTPTAGTGVIATQQVFMPDSWQEIVELCACQRLALWEGASQYIEYFEGLLRTKGIDIAAARARKAQMVRDELHNERSMTLRTGTYTWA